MATRAELARHSPSKPAVAANAAPAGVAGQTNQARQQLLRETLRAPARGEATFQSPGGGATKSARKRGTAPPVIQRYGIGFNQKPEAKLTMDGRPDLHLGEPGFGKDAAGMVGHAMFKESANGGELFFTQIIFSAERGTRVGRVKVEDTIENHLDGGPVVKNEATPVDPKTFEATMFDSPGQRAGKAALEPNQRVTIRIDDKFLTFPMWRPAADAPTSEWVALGYGAWGWRAVATGRNNATTGSWKSDPVEAFHICENAMTFAGVLKTEAGQVKKPPFSPDFGLPTLKRGQDHSTATPDAFPDATTPGDFEKCD